MIELEYITENFIIPITITIATEISEKITKGVTAGVKEKKQLERVIKKAVDISLPKTIDKKVKTSIADRISLAFNSSIEFDVKKILSDTRKEFPEELSSINSYEVEMNISYNLTNLIIATPDLRLLIDYKTMERVLIISQKNDENLRKIALKIDNCQELFLETMGKLSSYIDMINNMSRNSKEILDEYQNYFSKPLFLEKNMADGKEVFLKDVYIENSFIMLDFNSKKESRKGLFKFINDFVNDKLLAKNYSTSYSVNSKDIKVLFVKGQPGSGKSSLFYALAHYKTHDIDFLPDKYFYFVKLVECFSNSEEQGFLNPLSKIMNYLNIDNLDKFSVFVLDGLDEICTLKGFDSQSFCERLIVECFHKKCKCIITTRLNYINISHLDNKNVISIQLHELSASDLNEWMNKYFLIHNSLTKEKEIAKKNVEYMIKNEDKRISDIFAVPLLFYMIIATSIDIQEIDSIGELYDKVFDELRSRKYNDNRIASYQVHGILRLFKEDMARKIAMEIATIMYKHNDLLIKINSSELRDSINAISDEYMLDDNEKEEIEKLYPITFFYKQEHDVVEFAHKSIMEFFAANHLYLQFISFDGTLSEYIEKYMLEPIITGEIMSFFMYFWKKGQQDKIKKRLSDKILQDNFDKKVKHSTGISAGGTVYKYEDSYVFFKIYWFFLREVLAIDTELIKKVFFANDGITSFFYNILSVRILETSSFFDNSQFPWDFSKIDLIEASFHYCDLGRALFKHSHIENGEFKYCNLCGAKFIINSPFSCNFTNCSLYSAEFMSDYKSREKQSRTKIDFSFCDLSNVEFSNINLCEIKFSFCGFSNIKLNTVLTNLETIITLLPSVIEMKNVNICFEKGSEAYERIMKDKDLAMTAFKNAVYERTPVSINKEEIHFLFPEIRKEKTKSSNRKTNKTPLKKLKAKKSKEQMGPTSR